MKKRIFLINIIFIFIISIPTLPQNGKIIPSYNDTEEKLYKDLRDTLKYYLFLETVTNDFNSIFNIEEDVYIVITQGNEINAFYDDNSKMIIITYELINYLYESFKNSFSFKDELNNAVSNMTKLILFHELCHCLIDLNEFPVERWDDDESTDEFMTLLLIEIDDNYKIKAQLLEALKQFFYISSLVGVNIEELPYWDENNMSPKRFDKIICWIYGADKIKYTYLYDLGILPKDISENCQNNYNELKNKWEFNVKKILK